MLLLISSYNFCQGDNNITGMDITSSSSSSVLVHHSKLNIVVPAHACGNKLKVVISMLIRIGPYTV